MDARKRRDLAQRLQVVFDRCKEFPENTPGGFMALLELRNMMPDVIAALESE